MLNELAADPPETRLASSRPRSSAPVYSSGREMALPESHTSSYSRSIGTVNSTGSCRQKRQSDGHGGNPSNTSPARDLALSALILPVDPVHVMNLEVAGNGYTNCRKEEFFANLCEQSEPLQLVLYGILELGKAKLDAHRV
jgi:hypothetical protein